MKERIDMPDFMKIKILSSAKDIVKRMRRQATGWETVFVKDKSEKIHNELLELNNKKTNSPTKKWADPCPGRYTVGTEAYEKTLHFRSSRKCKFNTHKVTHPGIHCQVKEQNSGCFGRQFYGFLQTKRALTKRASSHAPHSPLPDVGNACPHRNLHVHVRTRRSQQDVLRQVSR